MTDRLPTRQPPTHPPTHRCRLQKDILGGQHLQRRQSSRLSSRPTRPQYRFLDYDSTGDGEEEGEGVAEEEGGSSPVPGAHKRSKTASSRASSRERGRGTPLGTGTPLPALSTGVNCGGQAGVLAGGSRGGDGAWAGMGVDPPPMDDALIGLLADSDVAQWLPFDLGEVSV